MNEQELRELLTLVRGIEHFIVRCLKTLENTRSLESQGVVITPGEDWEEECTEFEF